MNKSLFSLIQKSVLGVLGVFAVQCFSADAPDFTKQVAPILAKHCISCHGPDDVNGELRLDTFTHLMKGGEEGADVVPGKSDKSRLIKLVESKKKGVMPPGKRKKLEAAEIATLKAWIDAGANPPANKDEPIVAIVEIPKIAPKTVPPNGIYALTYSSKAKLLALGRHAEVELMSSETLSVARTLMGHSGNFNAVAFSADGSRLAAVSGNTGMRGEAKLWNTADGKLIRAFDGHKDAVYSVALSPDGKILATGSYDQTIKLWETESGKEIKTLTGHNGAVFSLAFRPDGKILASASLDRTVKLWDVATGNRLDTLSQSLKELYTLAFSPDGKRLAAGGVDSRIRVWQISDTAVDGTNPILYSIFAHDGAILKLAFSENGESIVTSAEDNTVKIWASDKVTQKLALEKQPDFAPGLSFIENGTVAVGRLNGTFTTYDAMSGKPPKAELNSIEPPGVQRGVATKIKLVGKNLKSVTAVKCTNAKVTATLQPESGAAEAWALITAPADMSREKVELFLDTPAGESAKMALFVDDLPQLNCSENSTPAEPQKIDALPVSVWGKMKMVGDMDYFSFEAKGGQTIVCDTTASSLGSKGSPLVTLADAAGKEVIGKNVLVGSNEPLIAFSIPADGRYVARVNDAMLGGSKNHFYRVSLGAMPYVTGCFPLSVKAGVETEITLYGFNLPPNSTLKVNAAAEGEHTLPLDAKGFRSRMPIKVFVDSLPEIVEAEPNDLPQNAQSVSAPASIAGRISVSVNGKQDADIFKFEAKAGQHWIVETSAAQRNSPLDTKIEILTPDGKPVPRLMLQAVRDSYINFRALDSNGTGVRLKNFEEMELNEYVYFQGDVARIFRAPQGPDSDSLMYPSATGARRCYFDSSPAAHANDSVAYIVEPHAPGDKLTPNGLPVFPLNFANDDDGERRKGTDSKIHFTVPADGTYLVRVTDTRGYGGENFVYRLLIRQPKPDFNVSVNGENPMVNAGSGRSFSLKADRLDGFDGEIKIDISGLPPGFTVSTPLVIEAGHFETFGTLFAAADAPETTDANGAQTKLIASATIDGKTVTKELKNFGRIKLAPKPKVFVSLEPYSVAEKTAQGDAGAKKPLEITIAPGQTVPAWLKITRNGHTDLLTFSVDNLPHGVIVDNIGLNGVLIEKGLNERQIFLTAAKWVGETDRYCYAVENQAGRQTSLPVLLHVRKPAK
jgi:dipeptidyl aminopeptidase/acylaminoacyl peptidase